MNAPDRSGRILLGLARPLPYRPRAVERGRAITDWADPGIQYRTRRQVPEPKGTKERRY